MWNSNKISDNLYLCSYETKFDSVACGFFMDLIMLKLKHIVLIALIVYWGSAGAAMDNSLIQS